eukprot:m51a1_g4629 putative C-tail anchored protein, methyltransferase and zinc finger domain (1097) ;mRNA; f:320106-324918
MAAPDCSDDPLDAFDPALFINKAYTEREYAFGPGLTVTLASLAAASTDYDLTGQVVWPASLLLSWFLVSRRGPQLRVQSVLELGAGAGLAGLVAARMCRRAVLTDCSGVVLEVLARNVAAAVGPARVSCECLRWGSGEQLDAFAARHEPFDTIVGADIRMLAKHDGAQLILAHQNRATLTDREFLYGAATRAGFVYEEIRGDALKAVLPPDGGGVNETALNDCVIVVFRRAQASPQSLDYASLLPENEMQNLELAFSVGETLGIPRLLDAEDMFPVPDKMSVITYTMGYYKALSGEVPVAPVATPPPIAATPTMASRFSPPVEVPQTPLVSAPEESPMRCSAGQLEAAVSASSSPAIVREVSPAVPHAARAYSADYAAFISAAAAATSGEVRSALHGAMSPSAAASMASPVSVAADGSEVSAALAQALDPPRAEHHHATPVYEYAFVMPQVPAGQRPKCSKCSKTIAATAKVVEALGKTFHEYCFECKTCRNRVSPRDFIAVDGEIYCQLHGRPAQLQRRASAAKLLSVADVPRAVPRTTSLSSLAVPSQASHTGVSLMKRSEGSNVAVCHEESAPASKDDTCIASAPPRDREALESAEHSLSAPPSACVSGSESTTPVPSSSPKLVTSADAKPSVGAAPPAEHSDEPPAGADGLQVDDHECAPGASTPGASAAEHKLTGLESDAELERIAMEQAKAELMRERRTKVVRKVRHVKAAVTKEPHPSGKDDSQQEAAASVSASASSDSAEPAATQTDSKCVGDPATVHSDVAPEPAHEDSQERQGGHDNAPEVRAVEQRTGSEAAEAGGESKTLQDADAPAIHGASCIEEPFITPAQSAAPVPNAEAAVQSASVAAEAAKLKAAEEALRQKLEEEQRRLKKAEEERRAAEEARQKASEEHARQKRAEEQERIERQRLSKLADERRQREQDDAERKRLEKQKAQEEELRRLQKQREEELKMIEQLKEQQERLRQEAKQDQEELRRLREQREQERLALEQARAELLAQRREAAGEGKAAVASEAQAAAAIKQLRERVAELEMQVTVARETSEKLNARLAEALGAAGEQRRQVSSLRLLVVGLSVALTAVCIVHMHTLMTK